MRILAIEPGPAFSVQDVHRGWRTALTNLGCEVLDFNLSNRLSFYASAKWDNRQLDAHEVSHLAIEGVKGKCYEFWPDVLLITSAFFISDELYELWKLRPHKRVMLLTESPYEDDKQLERVEQCEPDVVILNDPIHIDDYRKICPRTYYFPHAYDPTIHYRRPSDPELASDFAFLGTGYPSRIEFFEQVDWTGIDYKFAGTWPRLDEDSPLVPALIHPPEECFDNVHAPALYSSARASANLYRAGRRPDLEANTIELAEGWAMGPREVELAACGTFFLREPRPEGDEVLKMLPTFTQPDEFSDKLRWWLRHDSARTKAAEEARIAVRDRTFDAHARRLLQLLG